MDFVREVPPGLSSRAQDFMTQAAVWEPSKDIARHVRGWLEGGTPPDVVVRMHAYQQTWGGLRLPLHFAYRGGVAPLNAEEPVVMEGGCGFLAGSPRNPVPYRFVIGPDGQFGLYAGEFVPLHRSVEGWVEALALGYLAESVATREVSTPAREDLLAGLTEIPEVAGVQDTWWHGPDRIVGIHTGKAKCATTYFGATLAAVDEAAANLRRNVWPR